MSLRDCAQMANIVFLFLISEVRCLEYSPSLRVTLLECVLLLNIAVIDGKVATT